MMATIEDLRAVVLKNPEALAGYDEEKTMLANEMTAHEEKKAQSEKEETHVFG